MGTSLAVQWLRLNNNNNKRTHVRTMWRERAARRGGPKDQVGWSHDTQQTLVKINRL